MDEKFSIPESDQGLAIVRTLQECTRTVRLSGWREEELEKKIASLRERVATILDRQEGKQEIVEAVQGAVKLQAIACFRSNPAAFGDSVFAENHKDTFPYLRALTEEVQSCGKETGWRTRGQRRAAAKIAAYHGAAFAGGFFSGNAIVETLSGAGLTMSPEEIQEVFSKGVRLRFAVHNIRKPLEAVSRCARHVKNTLTDAKIKKKLAEEGITMSDQEFQEVFSKGVRLHFAVGNIRKPLEGIVRWVNGSITTPWGPFADYRKSVRDNATP
jgi:hypothetical protein